MEDLNVSLARMSASQGVAPAVTQSCLKIQSVLQETQQQRKPMTHELRKLNRKQLTEIISAIGSPTHNIDQRHLNIARLMWPNEFATLSEVRKQVAHAEAAMASLTGVLIVSEHSDEQGRVTWTGMSTSITDDLLDVI